MDKPLVWLHGEVRTPPMSVGGRVGIGVLLRRLQAGESLEMPQSRPMSSIGPRCHELRVADGQLNWRVVYRSDPDAVVVLEVFGKRTGATPHAVIAACRDRLRRYEAAARDGRREV